MGKAKIWLWALLLAVSSSASWASSLIDAARDGHYDLLKQLIQQGADINQTNDPHTPPPLAIVVSKGNIEMAQYLLQQGADANALSPGSGCNLLQLAAGAFDTPERIDMVKLLTEAGTNIDFISRSCASPIIEAAIAGHFNTVKYLLAQGANPNLQYRGNTALIEAIINGQQEIAQLLLDHNANTNLASSDGATALLMSAQFLPTLYPKIIALGAQKTVDKNGRGSLGYAIVGNNPELIAQLVEQQLHKSELDDALQLAVGKQQVFLAAKLLVLGANPKALDRWGDSAMSIAKKINNADINRLLGLQ